jgi:hypothetical protein
MTKSFTNSSFLFFKLRRALAHTEGFAKTRHPSHTGGTFQKGEDGSKFAGDSASVPTKPSVTAEAEEMQQNPAEAGFCEVHLQLPINRHADESEGGGRNLSEKEK